MSQARPSLTTGGRKLQVILETNGSYLISKWNITLTAWLPNNARHSPDAVVARPKMHYHRVLSQEMQSKFGPMLTTKFQSLSTDVKRSVPLTNLRKQHKDRKPLSLKN